MSPTGSFSPLRSEHERKERQPPDQVPAAEGLDASDVAMGPQPIYGSRKASLVLDIIVVGCGIGGLSAAFCLSQAGHHVTIIEAYPVIGEVGAGIQVTPNSSRLLWKWGLKERLEEIAVRPEGVAHIRYCTGEQIGFMKWAGVLERDYGSPYYHMHRADLHKLLYDLTSPHVTIRLGSAVVGCDPNSVSPSVTLDSGEVVQADLIIGADGVKSHIQRVVSGEQNPAELTGDAVYRATMPASLLTQDPELREFIERPQMTGWIGPGKWVVGYPIRRKEVYYLVLLHPDDGSVESWRGEGDPDKMRRDFADFEPRVRKLLSLVKSILKWRLTDGKALDKWVHDSAPIVLLGDSCHPILPYRAQGAAMAIEDSAVLGNLLSRISHRSQLQPLLKAYQNLRIDRTMVAQESSRRNRVTYTLPDGPEQRARDEKLRKAMSLELADSGGEPDGSQYQREEKKETDSLYGYDADAEADKWWAEHGKELELWKRSRL